MSPEALTSFALDAGPRVKRVKRGQAMSSIRMGLSRSETALDYHVCSHDLDREVTMWKF